MKIGTTPLMIAARRSLSKIVELLLIAGARKDIRDNEGNNLSLNAY